MYRAMLASPGKEEDLDRDGYVYEPKLDGTRAFCYKEGGIRFINRRDRDITERYPELDVSSSIQARDCVLDGEIVVFDDAGNPSFRLLQKREQTSPSVYHLRSRQHPSTYVVFDILMLDGQDLTSLPLSERRIILENVVTEGPSLRKIVQTMEGRKLWKLIMDRGVEGVMAKRMDGRYEQGVRSQHWLKIKTTLTVDCVVVGYSHEKRAISSLALALYENDVLVYVGRVGTGFTEDQIEHMVRILEPLSIDVPPVVNVPEHDLSWVKPEMVCKVEFLEMTINGHLRAPSFRGLRYDKPPKDCGMDQVR
jgi:DNA ligase D-like protein (predicted ligase)